MTEGDVVKDVHVGEALRAWCKRNNLTRQKLADKMELPKSNIDRIFSKPTIDTNKLLDFSLCLGCNFFAEMWGGRYIVDAETEMKYLDTTPSYIHIGNRIEICLREKKITQNQLATYLGVQRPVVSKLLRKDSIDSGRLVAISNYLGYDFFADFYINAVPNELKAKQFLQEKVTDLEKTKDQDEGFKTSLLKRNEELAVENAKYREFLENGLEYLEQWMKEKGLSLETTNIEQIKKLSSGDQVLFFWYINLRNQLSVQEKKGQMVQSLLKWGEMLAKVKKTEEE